jgi:hypothetical protein
MIVSFLNELSYHTYLEVCLQCGYPITDPETMRTTGVFANFEASQGKEVFSEAKLVISKFFEVVWAERLWQCSDTRVEL